MLSKDICIAYVLPHPSHLPFDVEYCDVGYLRDYVLNRKNNFDPEDFAKQIANGK